MSCAADVGNDNDVYAPKRTSNENILRYNAYEEPATIDPSLVHGGADALIVRQLFEGLVSLEPITQIPIPAVASSWTQSEDGKSWDFLIRPEATWSDGRAVSAEDFRAGIERVLRPSTMSRQAPELYVLKNAKAFHQGKIAMVVGKHVRPRRPPFVTLQEDLTSTSTLATLATFEKGVAVELLDSNLRRVAGQRPLLLRKTPDEKSEVTSTLAPHQDALIIAKRGASKADRRQQAWVQLRPPDGGQAGWTREKHLIVVYPELNFRRVEGERRFSSRVPLRVAASDHADVAAWVDDDQEIEVLSKRGAWLLAVEPISGRSGFIREDHVDNEYGDRHWLLVRTKVPPPLGGDGRPKNSSYGWLPARELFRSGDLLGIRAEQDTLHFELEQPQSSFLASLASPAFFPLPQHVLVKSGSRWSRLEHLVANGAFILERRRSGDHLFLSRSERYWNRNDVHLDGVEVLFVVDEHTTLDLFRTGRLDALAPGHLPVEALPALKRSAAFRSSNLFASYFLNLNTTRAPFDDVRIRRAFHLAIDRRLLSKVLLGMSEPATHLVPPGAPDYPVLEGLAADTVQARKLLAEAGFPDGKKFPRVEYLFHSGAQHKLIAEVLQAMWLKELNVEVSLVNQEWKTYVKRVERRQYEIAKADFVGATLDPALFLGIFSSSSGDNHTGFRSTNYDDTMQKAKALLPSLERNQLLATAEEMLNRELPLLPLLFFRSEALVLPEVQGLAQNQLGTTYFKNVYFDGMRPHLPQRMPALDLENALKQRNQSPTKAGISPSHDGQEGIAEGAAFQKTHKEEKSSSPSFSKKKSSLSSEAVQESHD
ncbi:MAG: hypothetical protein GY822_22380 [Deltaproteobacteria bacterium]|nr:hypothetical protein [Deltaproteobacteria bacterium]